MEHLNKSNGGRRLRGMTNIMVEAGIMVLIPTDPIRMTDLGIMLIHMDTQV